MIVLRFHYQPISHPYITLRVLTCAQYAYLLIFKHGTWTHAQYPVSHTIRERHPHQRAAPPLDARTAQRCCHPGGCVAAARRGRYTRSAGRHRHPSRQGARRLSRSCATPASAAPSPHQKTLPRADWLPVVAAFVAAVRGCHRRSTVPLQFSAAARCGRCWLSPWSWRTLRTRQRGRTRAWCRVPVVGRRRPTPTSKQSTRQWQKDRRAACRRVTPAVPGHRRYLFGQRRGNGRAATMRSGPALPLVLAVTAVGAATMRSGAA